MTEGTLGLAKVRVQDVPSGLDLNGVKVNTDKEPSVVYGEKVTLLYKVTVSNSNVLATAFSTRAVPGGNDYTVTDAGAKYVGAVCGANVTAPSDEYLGKDTVVGTLGPDQSIDLYFTK